MGPPGRVVGGGGKGYVYVWTRSLPKLKSKGSEMMNIRPSPCTPIKKKEGSDSTVKTFLMCQIGSVGNSFPHQREEMRS